MVGPDSSDDRGQAYTLESLIAALLLVTAVLFALQSVVITPTSAGTLDRDVAQQRHQQASDALVTAANDDELSTMVRHWDCSNAAFASDDRAGAWASNLGYTNDTVPVAQFGETLDATFGEGVRYNVELRYDDGSDQAQLPVVQQGTPGSHVVTASYTVTLTDDQLVTAQDEGDRTLAECDADNPPIPDVHGGSDVYNVVEVRLVVW